MIKINFGRKSQLRTGIDIGSSSIKLVQLSVNSGRFTLVKFDAVDIDPKKKGEEPEKVLQTLVKGLSGRDVAVSVSGPSVIVRYIELPRMSEEELKSSIRFEAEKHIPFNIKDAVLDCQPVEDIGRSRMRVLLVAAKKDAVLSRLGLARKAGLSVKTVDCDSFAMMNAFLFNFPDIPDDANTVLLNLGESLTTINILKGKAAYLTREIQVGGHDLIEAIPERLGLKAGNISELIVTGRERIGEILDSIEPVIAHMLEEVRLSLNYYESQTNAAISKVFLSGGLSGFEKLVELFGARLGIECRPWDPFKRVKIAEGLSRDKLNIARNRLAVAVGLAVRG